MADASGLSRRNVHLAIIGHGAAMQSVLGNDAYKAATGKDNASIALLDALPLVNVATSATMARATLHAQGYATFPQ